MTTDNFSHHTYATDATGDDMILKPSSLIPLLTQNSVRAGLTDESGVETELFSTKPAPTTQNFP
ncbi:hypothetical protein LAY57_26550 [Argonema antarcticum A004/B2]|nr:hypothetical protein [Argonema antarcticum A004/B2]